MQRPDLAPETLAVVGGRPDRRPGAPVSPPVELSSTYVSPGDFVPGLPDYGRYANATWESFEEVVGALEGAPVGAGAPGAARASGAAGASGATAFASGMAAGTALLSLVPRGGRVVMGATSYNAMLQLARERADAGDFALATVDVADFDAVVAALPGADWLLLESPTNPLLEVADLPAVAAAASDAGVRVGVDNTFATPLLQQPLTVGADVVMHSATKYLAGHSDVLLGVLVTGDAGLHERIRHHRSLTGGIPGPFEAWLALRGVRTLGVRLARQQQTAGELARRLAGHPRVERVRYPGLPGDPGHAVAARTMRGFGAMLAFEPVGGRDAATAVTERVRLWVPATSLGGVESLVERRRRIPSEPDRVPEGLLRLSVGLEDVADLWSDLEQALG